ncbi:MAG: PilZ domain-containing protein [Proteobacteria bacterium]|jgi:c-di-GMP-binding flagellar brake protein YcgR|nr:PilZ domain-containing protein [Desulfocapsa sp.]MBU3944095.1 PilZ domain-containing protein [Pseudomonadota bacterium]MCG2743976.1 PilZ domain-containing protein [Desulfobacteraceae bacterium]MBU4029764.1 PilZ domain-containing protein [Pseudomonadota bacterium]MBU4043414.1 PilZ domain-containing protein [Pseudomonadota bacterium]
MPYSLVDLIKKLQDSQAAEINLPLLSGGSVQLKCIYKESEAPHFFLVFPPKQLPLDIDTKRSCLVAVKGEDKSITFKAGIESSKGDRILELVAQNTIDPTSMRAYYRADVRAAISASYEPGPEERAKAWNHTGETLDLSGGGTLAIFPKEFLNKQRIKLHIKIPHTDKEIHCLSHVIRMKKLRREHWQIALQFDELEQKERDFIVSCCLKEQRRQLRENIQIA